MSIMVCFAFRLAKIPSHCLLLEHWMLLDYAPSK
jgi:hypothetical protein